MRTAGALERWIDRVAAAREARTALEIRGGGSKGFYGNATHGAVLDTREFAGITSYEPTELVVTARAGTPLAELEAALAARGQWLPFEPPHFDAGGTVGGMVAAGLSGPARASAGALRDFVLGLTLLTGDAQVLTFGGQVMKNVAGYDVSRLLAGSLGILGVICEVSLKVMPVPAECKTLTFEMDEAAALARLRQWSAQPFPMNASVWHDGRLAVRLAGARAAVTRAFEQTAGRELEAAEAERFWSGIRDHRHAFFVLSQSELRAGEALWRLSVPSTAPELPLAGVQLIEWAGGLRWWRSRAPAAQVRAAAAAVGGQATLFRAADMSPGAFVPLPRPLLDIHRRLKRSFDPAGIFNPGRLYPDL